jgi:protein-S-isoprenylcysteine O-methyltransferase Ste14
VRAALARRLGPRDRAFRLGYNIVALSGLLALFAAAYRIGGPVVFAWGGASSVIGAVFLLAALFLVFAGARAYDMGVFLGLTQLDAGSRTVLAHDGTFRRDGILAVIRHPWYAAVFLVLWSGAMTWADLVLAVGLSIYTVIGTRLEERRMLAEFGDAYARYREEVPAYVPWKGAVRALRRLSGKAPGSAR